MSAYSMLPNTSESQLSYTQYNTIFT